MTHVEIKTITQFVVIKDKQTGKEYRIMVSTKLMLTGDNLELTIE